MNEPSSQRPRTLRRPSLAALGGRGDTVPPLPRQAAAPLTERRQGRQASTLRLLMVEDSAADGRLVVELLREAGVDWLVERVDRVGDAQAYLLRHRVDCVLLDLGVLDADGLDGLQAVVTSGPTVPVVVLTRRDDDVLSMEALRHGAQDYLSKRGLGPDALARSIRYAIERKTTQLQLLHLAQHDPLTGLANRALFLDRLETALRRDAGVATVFVDVDNLKLVNDSLGHAAGDRLLVEVGRHLTGVVRPTDTVARLGGDEFAIVCPGLCEPGEALELAGRLMAQASSPLVIGTKVYVPSLSMGLALTEPGAGVTAELAVAQADRALYVAKRRGKARVELYDASLHQHATDQLLLHSELRTAAAEEQFEVHYQPQVSLDTGELVAVEALVRWAHPSRGLLSAGSFIDGIEEIGMAASMGSWVMQRACEALAAWPSPSPPRMAINISPRQFSLPGFLDGVQAVLAATGVRPEQLELEVTESALLVEDSVAQVLRDLAALGVRLAVDDFGTGFSSLNHLKLFPASTVKIDRSFVAGLGVDRVDEAIVQAVLDVSRTLGLCTVGEGVETEGQRARLAELGCELGQGYLLARPVPRDVLFAGLGRGRG